MTFDCATREEREMSSPSSSSSFSSASSTSVLLATIINENPLPSFFELTLLAQVDKMLEPAVVHIVNVILNRFNLEDSGDTTKYSNKLYFLLKLALEFKMLHEFDATFAENMYGLRRVTGLNTGRLENMHRYLSIIAVVVLPKLLNKRRSMSSPSSSSLTLYRTVETVTSRALNLAGIVYDAASVHQQFLYIFGYSDHFEPINAFMHVTVMRAKDTANSSITTGTASSANQSQSQWPLYAFAVIFAIRIAQSMIPSNQETGLISFITNNGGDVNGSDASKFALSPIPERPKPPVCKNSGTLPKDKRLCPICRKIIRLPSTSTGGYVFCYHCLLAALRQEPVCPISGKKCKENDVIRMFEDDFTAM